MVAWSYDRREPIVVSRAWPFESKTEGVEKIRTPEDFIAKLGTEGTEAIVIRIGANDAQVVLVDGHGRWDRWVYHSMEEALEEAETLGVPVHENEYPEKTRVRMGKYQPGPEHFDAAAYPEQGQTGPILSYPENRPRRLSPKADRERSQG